MSVPDVEPPWVVYPRKDPWWGGWRQSDGEVWLLGTWYPFWRSLGPEERAAYMERWPPPNEDWREYLTVHWV